MPEDSVIPKMSFYKSRQRLDITKLTPENIVIEDIAHDLAILPRYAGGTARPYSVAEHSIMVMQMVEDQTKDPTVLLQALMHDACEYITGDVPAPVKAVIPQIRAFEQNVLWPIVCEAFDMPVEIHQTIKDADWVALYVEAYSLHVSDELPQWENYDKYMPAAAAWMEVYGEIAPSNMPHPALIEQVFLDSFNALQEARRVGATAIDISGDMDDLEEENVG